MDRQKMRISYDPHGDVLYVSWGEPSEALSEEMEPGVIVRKDPSTDGIVGFTVVDFLERFKNNPQDLVLPPSPDQEVVETTA